MPTLVWTFFYIAIKWFDGNTTSSEVLTSIISIPFSAQGHGVLWFMYTLLGLYLVTPILHAWLRNASEKDIRFYLLLWLITMCYPLLQIFVEVNDTSTGMLYYFSGYVGYFVLGYWLQSYGEKLSLKVAALLMCLSVVAPIVVKIMQLKVDFYSLFWYLSVFVAIQCVFWWKMMKRLQIALHIPDRVNGFITVFSNLSFGIYLSHIFIMRHFVWHIPFVEHINSQLIQIVVVTLLTLTLSFIVSLTIGITPLGNAIVGWRKK